MSDSSTAPTVKNDYWLPVCPMEPDFDHKEMIPEASYCPFCFCRNPSHIQRPSSSSSSVSRRAESRAAVRAASQRPSATHIDLSDDSPDDKRTTAMFIDAAQTPPSAPTWDSVLGRTKALGERQSQVAKDKPVLPKMPGPGSPPLSRRLPAVKSTISTFGRKLSVIVQLYEGRLSTRHDGVARVTKWVKPGMVVHFLTA